MQPAALPCRGAACVRLAGAGRAGLWPGGGADADGAAGSAPTAIRAHGALRSRSAWRRCGVPVVAMSARSRCTIGIRNPAMARIAAVQVFLEQGIVHRAAPVPEQGHDGPAAGAAPISKTDNKRRINDGRGMLRRVTMMARAVAWWPPARPRLTYSRYHFRAPPRRPFFRRAACRFGVRFGVRAHFRSISQNRGQTPVLGNVHEDRRSAAPSGRCFGDRA